MGAEAADTASVRAASVLRVVPPVAVTNPSELARRTDAADPGAADDPRGSTDPDEAADRPSRGREQADGAQSDGGEKTDARGLTEEEQAEVQRLKQRDREVRRHEQAHAAVGGPYAGAPRYQFERGPDGRQYAVSGSVSIDVSPIPNNPRATIRKMDVVVRAALAPAEPSSQDRRVAAEARQTRQQAQVELREEKAEELAERIEAQAERRATEPGAQASPDRSRFAAARDGYNAASRIDGASAETIFSLVA